MKNNSKSFGSLVLALGVCATALCVPVQYAVAESFTAEQKVELEKLFKQFLADNPEDILKSVDDYRADQEKQSQQSALDNLEEYQSYFAGKDLPIVGNVDGDVTLVEYFDYNCGYCRKAFEDVLKLIEEDKGLRVVFQEMPILSPSSQIMAEVAMAAHKQGKYFEIHKALMNYRGAQTEEAFFKVAEKNGVDLAQLKKDLKDGAIAEEIQKSSEMGRSLGIRGTPGFVIGEEIYPGYIGMDGLRDAIAKARAAQSKDK